ncbi:hypothetical protein L211DRAFT_280942 [Terfezia boudieri ATCC MYA-4762]|uniref:Uncharacterized protein n=1 Tax=Terfezia boudieri ATCC MYA-4762 TaxID=1051890 RepID=A0A3N4LP04_9PEZI|nr:hypothetical protein L211DRAFT_280942 [Terfezia boudieri ATCC MYA-4762]
MYERLGATSVVLEELSRKQQVQHHQQPPHERYILEGGKYSAPRSPVMKVEGSRPSSRLDYSKTPQSTSQAPEFLGHSVRAGGRVSPTLSDRSTTSTSTGIIRSRLQSPLPNKHQVLGLAFLSSPSVSTCCSLRRIPVPRHVASEDEEADDDSSSGEDMPTPQRGAESEEGTDYTSDSGSGYQEMDDPSSNSYTKRGSLRRKILKFNREEEPDTSDDSSEEEDMFDSDIGGSITSLQHTLTPMTASPEPNKAHFVTGEHDVEWKPRASALATVAKRVSYTGPVSGDLEPIYEQSVLSPMFGDSQIPERINSATSSEVNVNTPGNKSRIPVPSTTSAVAQRRRHLDSLSRLVVGKVVLARKTLQA